MMCSCGSGRRRTNRSWYSDPEPGSWRPAGRNSRRRFLVTRCRPRSAERDCEVVHPSNRATDRDRSRAPPKAPCRCRGRSWLAPTVTRTFRCRQGSMVAPAEAARVAPHSGCSSSLRPQRYTDALRLAAVTGRVLAGSAGICGAKARARITPAVLHLERHDLAHLERGLALRDKLHVRSCTSRCSHRRSAAVVSNAAGDVTSSISRSSECSSSAWTMPGGWCTQSPASSRTGPTPS